MLQVSWKLFLLLCSGCSAVLLKVACAAVEVQRPPPPHGVPQVCNNNLVFTPQTMQIP